jgi:MATE family multidrug resistance protein
MWTAVEANVVNVAVSFVLIFGHLGFEPQGIAGAAWGTFTAVSYRTIRLTLTLVGPAAAQRFQSRSTWRPSSRCLKGLLRIGLPCSFQWLCDVVVWAIFVNLLVGSKFGTIHLIATNTAWQYMRLSFLPTIGVGQALTALVGKSIGAGDSQRAIRETRIATLIIVAYMGTLSLIYWLRGPDLIRFFNTDSEVVRIGTTIMICAAVFQLFDGIGISYHSALRGAGDTFVPSMFFIISNWLMIVGGGWAMTVYLPHLESLGPWLAASSLIVISGLFLWWRWHTRAWMRINLFKTPDQNRK